MPEVYFAGDSAIASVITGLTDKGKSELERACAFIKDTDDQARLEAFIRQFGDTVHAPMADQRMEEIEEDPGRDCGATQSLRPVAGGQRAGGARRSVDATRVTALSMRAGYH